MHANGAMLWACNSAKGLALQCFSFIWLELCRVAKCCRKQRRTIRKWRLDRYNDDRVKG